MSGTRHTLSSLAALLKLEQRGADREIHGANTLEKAGADELSFLANPKYMDQLASSHAGAVIISPENLEHLPASISSILVSDHPYNDFARVLALFDTVQGCFSGISEQAYIHPDAEIEAGCTIYPFVFVGARARIGARSRLFSGAYVGEDCVLGESCTLLPNSVMMARVEIGAHCTLYPGAVLGADGFGFVRQGDVMQKIPQIGTVRLGNYVDVGANSAIDRAVMGASTVGDYTKIDNLVQIGHNVEMGRNCLIVSQVGISGSTKLGDNVTLAGQVGLAGHLHIGNNVTIGPQSGVAKDVAEGLTVGGSPAVEQGIFMRTLALMPRFPEIFKRLSKLEKMAHPPQNDRSPHDGADS